MILQHHIGDLFHRFSPAVMSDFSYDAIAHVCNCQGVMGSGIALAIKQRYSAAYQAYKQAEADMQKIPAYQGLQLGTISRGRVESGKEVYNLHAQRLYGTDKRHLNYEAMYVCLEELREQLAISGIDTLGIPYKMGCDRAGGDWDVVEAMLNSAFRNTDVEIYVMKLP